jgi:2-C-methyl-D-erythritol 4-phosphate cytidylyltransferase
MQNIAIIVSGGSGSRFLSSFKNTTKNNLDILIRTQDCKVKKVNPLLDKELVKQNVIIQKKLFEDNDPKHYFDDYFSVVETSLINFAINKNISSIILAHSSKTELSYIKKMISENKIKTPVFFTPSGTQRYNTVANALNFAKNNIKFIDFEACNVLVHDAARPFVSQNLINLITNELKNNKAVIPGLKINDTVKKITQNGLITVDRTNLYQVQTPQGFNFKDLYNCYQKIGAMDDNFLDDSITDDCSIFEKFYPNDILIVKSETSNIKITFCDDLT